MQKDRDYKDKCTKVTMAGEEDNWRKEKRLNYGKGGQRRENVEQGKEERMEAGGWRLETYPVRRIHEEDFNGDGWAEEENASEGGMEDETNIRCPDRQ